MEQFTFSDDVVIHFGILVKTRLLRLLISVELLP